MADEAQYGTLVEEQATLAAVLASMSDGFILLDADARVRYCNARACELVGLHHDETIGKSADECFAVITQAASDPAVAHLAWKQAAARVADRPSFELDIVTPEPRHLVCELFSVQGQDHAGQGVGVLLHDTTAAKQLALSEERDRIAMDLHDGAIQSLYAVALSLGAHERSLNGDVTRDLTEVRQALQQSIAQINGVIQEIRDYIVDLRVHELGERGLLAGISALAEELRLNALIRPELQLDLHAERALASDAVASILLIAREATSNIIRHAGATAVTISLVRDDRELVLAIRDNGRGFDPKHSGRRAGDGLRNMAERARMLGGSLAVESERGAGTEVRLAVPPRAGAGTT